MISNRTILTPPMIQTFSYEGREIPLSLHVAVVSLQECSRYDEVFAGLHNAIKDSRTN